MVVQTAIVATEEILYSSLVVQRWNIESDPIFKNLYELAGDSPHMRHVVHLGQAVLQKTKPGEKLDFELHPDWGFDSVMVESNRNPHTIELQEVKNICEKFRKMGQNFLREALENNNRFEISVAQAFQALIDLFQANLQTPIEFHAHKHVIIDNLNTTLVSLVKQNN